MSNDEFILEGYEKVKSVGKGSFGTATLYRRLVDDILVVMKDVRLTDMSELERRLAMNEVQVLAALSHENIIKYLGSFEKEGSLLIIMEYADGGNLAQLISSKRNKTEVFPETEILSIFSQICSGISYMHANKILHRDMKAANIFLNTDGTVKIGDFGISKMMDTRSQAQTVVGTPYYLSPEMCEGKDYNEKSDIWSMGCILYELARLRKPFEATSLPMLVQKITHCEYEPIPHTFSSGLGQLVQTILQLEPEARPSAQYIYDTIIPAIFERLEEESQMPRRFSLSSIFTKTMPKERSVLYELHGFTTDSNMYPVNLPHGKIQDFCRSETHFLVLMEDQKVFSWGEDIYGQLGHGHPDRFRRYPIMVEYFRGKNIIRCFAGNGYSIFLNDAGNMFSCGDGKYGCLGHGDWNNIVRPKIIESIINTRITDISCGSRHVLALAANGKVFSWGSANEGQLGLGHTQYCCKPISLQISNEFNIHKIYAGPNASALLTTSGKVMVSGNNSHNKLGVENMTYVKSFVMLNITERIKEISFGQNHTVFLSESGFIFCMGSNEDGQCGTMKRVEREGMVKVDGLSQISHISAGTCYTVAATEDNVIYFWGTHYKAISRKNFQSTQTSGSNDSSQGQLMYSNQMNQIETRFTEMKYTLAEETKTFMPILEPHPSSILAMTWTLGGCQCFDVNRLYSSPGNVKLGNLIWLKALQANDNSVSVLVNTTAPPPIKRMLERDDRQGDEDNNLQSQNLDHRRSNNRSNNLSANFDVSLPNTPHNT